jgi:hypothetical protein
MKVIVTSKSSSFASLGVHRIPISVEDLDEPVRDDYNQLSGFLSWLATPFRDAEGDTLDEDWEFPGTHCCKITRTPVARASK